MWHSKKNEVGYNHSPDETVTRPVGRSFSNQMLMLQLWEMLWHVTFKEEWSRLQPLTWRDCDKACGKEFFKPNVTFHHLSWLHGKYLYVHERTHIHCCGFNFWRDIIFLRQQVWLQQWWVNHFSNFAQISFHHMGWWCWKTSVVHEKDSPCWLLISFLEEHYFSETTDVVSGSLCNI
jgi:hypothetical protein